jgi:hypothetical protein
VQAVEIHLAKSLDGAGTWSAVKVLFPATWTWAYRGVLAGNAEAAEPGRWRRERPCPSHRTAQGER